MSTLLWSIGLATLLSTTSFLAIIWRVSPLSAPEQAVPAFFLSLFLTIASGSSLAIFGIWQLLPFHHFDRGTLLTMSIREGVFLGLGTTIILLFHILGILSLGIAFLVLCVFALIEVAMHV